MSDLTLSDNPASAVGPSREQRRQVIRLKRAGFSREAIVSETGVAMDDVIGIIGPEGATPVKLKLDGNWRRLGTSDSGPGRRPY